MIKKSLNIKIILLLFIAFEIQLSISAAVWQSEKEKELNKLLISSEILRPSNIDSCLALALKAYQISKEEKLPEQLLKSAFIISYCYEQKNEIERALEILEETEDQYFISNSDSNKVKLLMKKGEIFSKTGSYVKSLENFNEALKLSSPIDSHNEYGKILNSIGTVYKFKGDYADALVNHFEALKLFEENNYKSGIAASFGSIANVYESIGDNEKALNNYIKALEIFKEIGDIDQTANSFMNIGVIYFNVGKKNNALKNFLTAYDMASQLNNNLIMSYSLNNIAFVHNELGNYNESIKFYEKALSIAVETGDKWGIANTLNNIAAVYLNIKNWEEAYSKLDKAFSISREIGAKDLILESYKLKSDYFEKTGDYKEALAFSRLFKDMNDSLFTAQNQNRINDAKARYETEKKGKELAELQLRDQKKSFIFSLVLIILLIIIAAVSYALYLKKKKSSEFMLNVINSVTHSFIVYDVYNETSELINKASLSNSSPYYRYLKESDKNLTPLTINSIIETRKPCSIEKEEVIHGKKKQFEFFGFPILNSKGFVSKIIEYAIDITEKKEALDKIRTAFEREKELNELKSNFISSTSHEFRTPLATLFSSVELIQHYDRTKSVEKKKYHLDRIKDIVVYMTNMLDNILNINKAGVDKMEFQPEIVDIRSFCDEILEDIIISASDNHFIEQIYEGEPAKVFVDPILLRHILTNLLSNSIKYSPEGGKILFKTEIHAEYLRLTVRDEGIGIPKEDIENLFQYFFRAKNSKSIPGTGLGLSIVKKSVEVHKGKIEISSNEGEGTTFIVTIPTNKKLVDKTNNQKTDEIANEENNIN